VGVPAELIARQLERFNCIAPREHGAVPVGGVLHFDAERGLWVDLRYARLVSSPAPLSFDHHNTRHARRLAVDYCAMDVQ